MVYCFGYNYVLMWLEREDELLMPKSICATTLFPSLSLLLYIHVFISFSYENILFFMPFVSHRFTLLRLGFGGQVCCQLPHSAQISLC